MKRLQSVTLARPAAAMLRVPRSRMEAATELVRLEFDQGRLERELNLLGRREKASSAALARTRARIAATLGRLTETGEK